MESAASSVLRTALVAGVLSLLLCRLVITMARQWRLTGKPALRRPNVQVSHLGSLGLAAACLLTLMWTGGGLGALSDPAGRAWVFGSLWLVAVGLIDDLAWELPPWIKGSGQVIAAALLISGGISVKIVYFPEWLNVTLSLLWIVGITNALNLLDILDGLAAVVTGIASAGFAILASWSSQSELALLAIALTGVVVGFLIFNWPPARLYMGDAGSQWLGFTLAALALGIRYAPLGREVALATPLIVLGLPVYDLLYVVWMRLRKGRSPFRKSRDHFALRLVTEGASPRVALLAMAGLTAGFVLVGLYVAHAQNLAGGIAVALVIVAAILWGRRLAVVEMDG